MEENKQEVVQVEVVEEKKGISKKKLLIGGVAVVGLVVAGIFALSRKNKDEDIQTGPIDVTYEPVVESDVEEQ